MHFGYKGQLGRSKHDDKMCLKLLFTIIYEKIWFLKKNMTFIKVWRAQYIYNDCLLSLKQ